MKTMTCRQMGGMCDEQFTAATPDEMVSKGMEHLTATHPEMAASIEAMPKDHPMMVAWFESFQKDWENTPEE